MRPWCAVCAIVLATTLALAAPAGGAARPIAHQVGGTAAWALQRMVTPAVTTGQSFSVSCVSSSLCESGGYYIAKNGMQRPLAEVWNGTSWSNQGAVTPSGATIGYFAGMTCTAANSCTAVGGYTGSAPEYLPILLPLAERWNGIEWSVQSVSSPANSSEIVLNSVACSTATACVAVGSYHQNSSSTDLQLPLAEVWNGSTWALEAPVDPTGADYTSLNSVSCTSSTACTAVGGFTSGYEADNTLAEVWNGASWKIQTTPNVSGANIDLLYGVKCTKASACIAVGASQAGSATGTLAERWNGTTWKVQPTPTPAGAGYAGASVSCVSASSCTAVWRGSVPVVEAWNGTTWATQTAPSPSGRYAELFAVACTASSACTAVGWSLAGAASFTLAERWSGSAWAIQSTPTPAGAATSEALGIACTTATACTAVGNYDNSAGDQLGLAEQWNGTAWTVETTATPTSAVSVNLSDVSCQVAVTSCTAVGEYSTTASQQPLAETWNGSSWGIETTSAPTGATASALNGVSCSSTTACTAVGQATVASGEVPLVERWSGTTWVIETTPTPAGSTGASLNAVSCAAVNACVAVGSYSTNLGAQLTLAEAWDGTTWTILTTANPSASQDLFNSVSCSAVASCEAVGGTGSETLAEAWNGTLWTVQSTPGPTTSGSSGVSCAAAASCGAVGDMSEAFFAQGWDGTSWVAQTLAQPAGVDSPTKSGWLSGVSCSAASVCTAVGYFFHDFIVSPDFLDEGAFTGLAVPIGERYS